MSRGTSGVAEEMPRIVAEPDDHRLVAAVRHGDDRAFEALYARYQRRIHAYVMGMVKDHGRAEDVTQEVFVSALRRMRETERPIAFKPWVYEIAKNACIDQFRRSRRAEEVSLQADEGLAPSDYLVGPDPTPDAAVAAKQDLSNLCGAFGGLSETHHEILVLRELEGMSYREIGERMGMSRPAVESTLFRARRRLTEEYDDLVSGARCLRIQGLIQTATTTRLGTREQRRLSRHVAHCQPCRREALAAGLDSTILTHVPLPKRAAAKVAALLPFPWLARWRGGGDGGASSGWAAQAPMLSEQLSGGWGKLATAAAVLVAGVGAAGVGSRVTGAGDPSADRDRPAAAAQRGAAQTGAGDAAARGARSVPAAGADRRGKKESTRSRRAEAGGDRRGSSDGSPGALVPASDAPDASGTGPVTGGGGGGAGADAAGGGGGSAVPSVDVPTETMEPARPVKQTVDNVVETVQPVVDGVTETVQQVAEPVIEPVEQTVQGVEETVGGLTDGLTGGGSGTP